MKKSLSGFKHRSTSIVRNPFPRSILRQEIQLLFSRNVKEMLNLLRFSSSFDDFSLLSIVDNCQVFFHNCMEQILLVQIDRSVLFFFNFDLISLWIKKQF
eukprot:TRINITY_DN4879_c0_g1_i4.p2 TRINITY_DN4879_c0_g1~~TRINITY_DN4879_c0_g1_i4.p2  ORF type:complete len:100 (+),score=0.74 TRINITY_DN4879_c0_g1_i4:42-341(+)